MGDPIPDRAGICGHPSHACLALIGRLPEGPCGLCDGPFREPPPRPRLVPDRGPDHVFSRVRVADGGLKEDP